MLGIAFQDPRKKHLLTSGKWGNKDLTCVLNSSKVQSLSIFKVLSALPQESKTFSSAIKPLACDWHCQFLNKQKQEDKYELRQKGN